MSRKVLFLLSIFAAVGAIRPALASDDNLLTRDQVRAEVLRAQAAGQLAPGGEAGSWSAPATGTPLSRAQVLRELATSGPVPTGEVADLGQARPGRGVVSRAEVHAEAVRAVQAGQIPGGER